MASKDTQQLLSILRRKGYTPFMGGGGHYQLKDVAGNTVYTRAGLPLTIPATPSDHRALRNARAELARAGVNLDDELGPVDPLRKPNEQRRLQAAATKLRLESVMRRGATVSDLVEAIAEPPASFDTRIRSVLSGNVPREATIGLINEACDRWAEAHPAIRIVRADDRALFIDIAAALGGSTYEQRVSLLARLADSLGVR